MSEFATILNDFQGLEGAGSISAVARFLLTTRLNTYVCAASGAAGRIKLLFPLRLLGSSNLATIPNGFLSNGK